MKVCKFGGTSMADAAAINMAADIVLAEADRKYVVVSAPGKRFSKDDKVTDLLIKTYALAAGGGDFESALDSVRKRFLDIIEGLNISLDLESEFAKIKQNIKNGASLDYVASRGEYLCALVVAKRLNFAFVDAEDIIHFTADGAYNAEYTNDIISKTLANIQGGVVVPGFYGKTAKGEIKTFSRGGSDITGAILARAVNAEVYENWTDVSGFKVCDPKIVSAAKTIDSLTYQELRELAYMGASVLHPESIFPVSKSEIPINIRNTFAPQDAGTMIVPTKAHKRNGRIVTGIAGKKDFVVIHIEKAMMNSELGFARRALSVLEHYGVSVEHIPSGIDTMSMVIEKQNLNGKTEDIMNDLRAVLNPDVLEVFDDLSLIATVGHGMDKRKGTAARLFSALYKADINVRMIDQGSSELNIIVGVNNADFENAIKAIYEEFMAN